MSSPLLIVLLLLAAAIACFVRGKPRMDVVALLVILAFPLTGILTPAEALAGFSDPNVILIAALFVRAGAHRRSLSPRQLAGRCRARQ